MDKHPAILYVEDDPKSRMIMDVLLKEHLQLEQVVIFEDSLNFEQNLAVLPFKPDVVFLDIHMKPLDGFQMLKILRSQTQFDNARIVALTASVMNEEVQQLRDYGFNGVISKPIDIITFPATLSRLLAGEGIWRIINR